jgi:class 3 adenylate cyclase
VRAELKGALAQEVVWTGDPERAGELAREGAEMARRVGEPRPLASALSRVIFVIALGPEGAEERMRIADEITALGESSGEREYALRGHFFRLRECLEVGDMPGVDRELARFTEVAEELRIPQWLWRIRTYRCMRSLIDGDLEAAERLAGEARAGGEQAQEPLANQLYAIQLLQVRRLQGRVGELRDPVRALADRYPALPAWRMALADIESLVGDVDAARVEFERFAAEDFSEVPEDAQWLAGMTLLGEVCAAVKDAERAGALYERILPYEELAIVVGPGAVCQGPVARILGLLAQAGGDAGKAEHHFEAALELATRMGDKPHRAMSQLNLAELLLDRDARGDRDRALELLGECLESSRQIGARGISDRALTLRLEAQGLAGVDVTTSIDDVISAVESERPDLRRHAAPDGTVTILFSDIEDSTLITERLGDERWLQELRAHNAVFRDQVRRHDGFEVKSQGDGFMLAFPDPRAAVECAIAVQRAFAARAQEGEGEPLRVRMGLHTGEVIAEEGDFFGKNVILAARIAARAGGGEILVSSPLKEAASNASENGELRFDDGRELELKGLTGTHTVYRAEWESQTAVA